MVPKQDYEEKWQNLSIKHLILSTNNFIVFIDPDFDIDWKTNEIYDDLGYKNSQKHHDIMNRVASLECIPNDHQNYKIRLNFKRMIGEGVARSLSHDYDNADKILDKAENYIHDRNIETSRFWQIQTSLICGSIGALIALIFWFYRHEYILLFGISAFYLILGALAGSVGATSSIIFRVGKSSTTSEAERKIHVLDVIARNFGGCVSGLIFSILIKVGIVVPIFQVTNMTNIAMIAGGLLAGASERWVPSLILHFENGTTKITKGDE